MGIDLRAGGRKRIVRRSNPKSENVYLRVLVRLYKFLARRTNSGFNTTVLRRLVAPNVHRPVMSIKRVQKYAKAAIAAKADTIVAVVGDITDDVRVEILSGLTVAALRVSETVRARIVKAGGKVITFDQLALQRPTGANCVLLRGKKSARTANKYFGKPGVPNSTVRPKIASKGRNFERGRGRRSGSGFKV